MIKMKPSEQIEETCVKLAREAGIRADQSWVFRLAAIDLVLDEFDARLTRVELDTKLIKLREKIHGGEET